MKTTTLFKVFIASLVIIAAFSTGSYAQLKVGSNPNTIGSSSNLEVEAANGSKTVIDKNTGTVNINGVVSVGTSLSLAGADDYTLKIDANGNVKKAPTETSIISTTGAAQLIGTLGADRNMYRKCFTGTTLPSVVSTGAYSFTNVVPIGSQNGIPRSKVSNIFGSVAELNVGTSQYRYFPFGYQGQGVGTYCQASVDEFGNIYVSWSGFTGFGGGIKEIVQVCVEYGVAKNQDTNNGNP
ncbi:MULTISPECIES: hypothetical protein [unclassified Spirosoma]|uniref:hypothetical protein n=1 Tax=unclassified Spirosoma TaxID=2621999 RepID=UPI0009645213|nr:MULTISPECIES: hypothetical protein [unclassified Spirosoma]MBN8820505.1 hypothetical protein [Spirosoma sp.]OJW71293.1 MAG: hypothetical protein BGO59_03515 [Spirosoma sp. 48-14]